MAAAQRQRPDDGGGAGPSSGGFSTMPHLGGRHDASPPPPARDDHEASFIKGWMLGSRHRAHLAASTSAPFPPPPYHSRSRSALVPPHGPSPSAPYPDPCLHRPPGVGGQPPWPPPVGYPPPLWPPPELPRHPSQSKPKPVRVGQDPKADRAAGEASLPSPFASGQQFEVLRSIGSFPEYADDGAKAAQKGEETAEARRSLMQQQQRQRNQEAAAAAGTGRSDPPASETAPRADAGGEEPALAQLQISSKLSLPVLQLLRLLRHAAASEALDEEDTPTPSRTRMPPPSSVSAQQPSVRPPSPPQAQPQRRKLSQEVSADVAAGATPFTNSYFAAAAAAGLSISAAEAAKVADVHRSTAAEAPLDRSSVPRQPDFVGGASTPRSHAVAVGHQEAAGSVGHPPLVTSLHGLPAESLPISAGSRRHKHKSSKKSKREKRDRSQHYLNPYPLGYPLHSGYPPPHHVATHGYPSMPQQAHSFQHQEYQRQQQQQGLFRHPSSGNPPPMDAAAPARAVKGTSETNNVTQEYSANSENGSVGQKRHKRGAVTAIDSDWMAAIDPRCAK